MTTPPLSCDTFVCLPPNTLNSCVIFGKNSDRPDDEVQEIIYQPQMVHANNSKQKCTYIEIDQVEVTYEVVLSKPCWMWGAEMGANEFGVCIGNEAVWTKLNNSREDLQEKLLGMDLVRLGLERSRSAAEAVQVITDLLSKYGQGGPCSDSMKNWAYHNSFLIADKKEAWVLETAGNKFWAAERVTSGYRNISNSLSIGVQIDLSSDDLEGEAVKLGFWDGKEPFHFAKAFSDDYDPEGDGRFSEGRKLLGKYSKDGKFDAKAMMKILRDWPSGICMGCEGSFVSTSSQVSVLTSATDGSESTQRSNLDCHWFTGTPDPAHSLFKPFIFPGSDPTFLFSKLIMSSNDESGNKASRSQTRNKYKHDLYKEHVKCYQRLVKQPAMKQRLMELENQCMVEVDELSEKVKSDKDGKVFKQLVSVFNNCVSKELEFYGQICNSE